MLYNSEILLSADVFVRSRNEIIKQFNLFLDFALLVYKQSCKEVATEHLNMAFYFSNKETDSTQQ